ncbi:DUF3078 domain-containing protein [Aureibacter tunicatorum]|uniref:DUF3078 domain-containing protein n=1 Tax=Aureibacter tunicatorum TaxID=866807 RepID=A0AAE3XQ68_9BACT|nr:DUF3078 domain-containing protein [Aureibacter tunicatorum]MDR6240030.1 hypothetical protein [Aureibacter tunicatorum]BDD04502.1 hypothetical protein AUTU_19850 [Aureibacter tunicatorum]
MKRIVFFIYLLISSIIVYGQAEKDSDYIEFSEKVSKKRQKKDSIFNEINRKVHGNDSITLLYKPDYLVISKLAYLDSLKPSLLDTVFFFEPPNVVKVEKNAAYDSIAFFQPDFDTIYFYMNPKFLLVDSTITVYPESKPKIWTLSSNTRLNFNWIELSNWAPGGNNTITLGMEFRPNASRKFGNISVDNRGEFFYGIMRDGELGIRKNSDLLRITSIQSRQFTEKLLFSSSVDFKTQFTRGYDYNDDGTRVFKSDFMAPGYLELGLGMSYLKKDTLNVVFSPIKGKITFVLDDSLSNQGVYGVKPGDKVLTEIGLGLLVQLIKLQPAKNLTLEGRVNLFAAYQKVTSVDIDFNAILQYNLTNNIAFSYNTRFVYDDDVNIVRDDGTEGPALQIRNEINVLVLLNWSN